jgi:peroxiredoxin
VNSTRKTYRIIIGIAVVLVLFVCAFLLLFFIYLKSGMFRKTQITASDLENEIAQIDDPTVTFTFAPIIRSTITPTSYDFIANTPNSEDSTITPILTLTPTNPFLLTPENPQVNYRAPNFTIPDLSGTKTITLSDYFGKPVVVDYWAAWCPPCREELPYIQTVYDEYRDQGLVVLAVDNIENDVAGDVEEFVLENNLSFEILLDESSIVMQRYEIVYLPTTIFIDRFGIIREIRIGSVTEEEFRELVQEILNY